MYSNVLIWIRADALITIDAILTCGIDWTRIAFTFVHICKQYMNINFIVDQMPTVKPLGPIHRNSKTLTHRTVPMRMLTLLID